MFRYMLLFGDQTTADVKKDVENLILQIPNSPSLRYFLELTTDSLRREIARLLPIDRAELRNFHSLPDLIEAQSKGNSGDIVISTVLLQIVQLGSLILNYESNPEALPSSEVVILGLCTGLLSAAAAGSSRSLLDLVKLGPEIVCLSFRLAVWAKRRSIQIESQNGSWATIVSDVPKDNLLAALNDFHVQENVPIHKHAYISAEAESAITISGPPSILDQLFATNRTFSNSRRVIRLPITAAFHASHLQKPEADHIVGLSALFDRPIVAGREILSTRSGTVYDADTLRKVLCLMVDDILTRSLLFNEIIEDLSSTIQNGEVTVSAFGPTNAIPLLKRSLQRVGIIVKERTSEIPWPNTASVVDRFTGDSGDIAVVGMAARLPGSETLTEFWEVLEKGKDLVQEIPADRFDADSHCDSTGARKNTSITPFGCFIDRPGYFDTQLFNMSPREAAQSDPTQRLILLTAYESLEMAGYSPGGSVSLNPKRIGTYFGQTTDDYREINAAQDIDLYYLPGGMRSFGPGRLNYHFKWEGPSFSIDTACSSSAAAIQLACSALLSRECDTAVAGGGNINTGPSMFAGLSRGGFLSPTGSCKTFDEKADGYCRGDGVGTVVLKRLEDAIADNDNIQGVIRSVATNHSAHAVSITHPHADTQKKLYQQVLIKAGVKPSEVSYIEMHGTGTQAGDIAEMNSVAGVFGHGRSQDNPLYVGAVKSNVGHGEAAAGVTSLIKSLLMFKKNTIPPHIGIKGKINHNLPLLDDKNIRIASSSIPFPNNLCNDTKRKILINNFNATGGNTSILVEEPPQRCVNGVDARSHHIVTLSAKTPYSLKSNIDRLTKYLLANPETSLADLSYTTTARRMHHVFRTSFVSSSTTELVSMLKQDSDNFVRTTNTPTVAFTFTGQGSQYSSMGKTLFEMSDTFRRTVLECDGLCSRMGLPTILEILINSDVDMETVAPIQVHLCMVSLEIALAKLWQSWGVQPNVLIGHSLGEYVALFISDVLSLTDTLFLVGQRAKLMQDMCETGTHVMLAIQESQVNVSSAIKAEQLNTCAISCLNSPTSVVVSGTAEDVARLQDSYYLAGVKMTVLDLPYAFHSSQMDPILVDFTAVGRNVRFNKPLIPIASTLEGKLISEEGVFSAQYLARQARQEVNFNGALEACRDAGIVDNNTLWIEIGPEPVCLGLVRSTLGLAPSYNLPSLRSKQEPWKTISKSLGNAYNAGININWQAYHKEYESGLSLLELPTYAFELSNHWLQYEGDWALHNKPVIAATSNPSTADLAPEPETKPLSTCLQRVKIETFTAHEGSVVLVSDPSEPQLFAAVQGHKVNGAALCPSSVYLDMACTAASYIYNRMEPTNSVPAIDVTAMEVFGPLVVEQNSNQVVEVSIKKSASSDSAHVSFSSRNGSGTTQHATCSVIFGDGEKWRSQRTRNAYLWKSRMDSMRRPSSTIDQISGPMVYKLFSNLVVYDKKYHGLSEVFLDCNLNEAAATVQFRDTSGSGIFTCNPYWTDSIVHLAGFVLNGNFNTPENLVYISNGWDSVCFFEPLAEGITYSSYVRMQPMGSRGLYVGDVYLFKENEIVAICAGLKFQELPKATLHGMLENANPSGEVKGQFHRAIKLKQSEVHSNRETSHSRGSRKEIPGLYQVAESASKQDSPSIFESVIEIVAAEIRIPVDSFKDEAHFGDLGVDSLLTVSITKALQKKLAINLPAFLFDTDAQVSGLRAYFGESNESTPTRSGHSSNDSISQATSSYGMVTGSTTPLSVSIPDIENGDQGISEVLLSVVASETGVPHNKLDDSTYFADLGVDSLMSISILEIVKERTGELVPANFFNDNPTVKAAKRALGGGQEDPTEPLEPLSTPSIPPPELTDIPSPNEVSRKNRSSSTAPSTSNESKPRPSPSTKFFSNAVFIQGRPKSDLKPLFLIADGAGSAASYIKLPPFTSGVPVYALESPFLHSPKDYTCTVEECATIILNSIRKIQPHGPYMLGGWSLGGIYSYEIARQLLLMGEAVKGIVLVDSPCPKPLPNMPKPTVEMLDNAGMFAGVKKVGKADDPKTLLFKQHIVACIDALRFYEPVPMPLDKRPSKVVQLWAKHKTIGRVDDKVDGAPQGGKGNNGWLKASRRSFGPNGWDRLLGDLECHVMDGDHFSVMNQPRIKITGQLISKAVEDFLKL